VLEEFGLMLAPLEFEVLFEAGTKCLFQTLQLLKLGIDRV
jgi:hypothetical protein